MIMTETAAELLQRLGVKVDHSQDNQFVEVEPTNMFRTVIFENLKRGDKKPARLSVRLNFESDQVIYTERVKSRAEVVGFVMPEGEDNEGLFVHETQMVDGDSESNTYHQFRLQAVKYATKAIEEELARISALPAEKQEEYKNLSLISNQLMSYLMDKNEFFMDLQKQVNNITSRKLPRVNEYMLYQGELSDKFKATGRVDYENPANAEFTEEQKHLVDTFLDTFLDDDSKLALSWYFGAALSNVDIHDDRVSKMMVVSSGQGGSGKSSLITGLTKALMGELYSTVSPSFDTYFVSNNRFATSTLPTTRMTVYSEAEFNDPNLGNEHNFKGLDISMIKSFIADGYISDEKKTKDAVIKRIHGLHTVLTNNVPVITDAAEALRRRLLPVVVKPTRMQDKAAHLGLVGQTTFNQYLVDNAQAFANYFVNVFTTNEYLFTYDDYDHEAFQDAITDGQLSTQDKKRNDEETLSRQVEAAANNDIIQAIDELAEISGVTDTSEIKKDIQLALVNGELSNMRMSDGALYIDSTKQAFMKYPQGEELRKLLIKAFGPTVRKFQKRMIKVDVKRA